MIQTFTLPVAPTPKGRPRFVRSKSGIPMAFTPDKTVDAEERIRWHLKTQGAQLIPRGVPIRFAATFKLRKPPSAIKSRRLPVTKPDLDNYCKLTQDACNGILWFDDAQIVQSTCAKVYANDGIEEILLEVEAMTGSPPQRSSAAK